VSLQLEKDRRQDAKRPRKDLPKEEERVAALIVDAAIKVHRVLGPGLLESVYEACLAHELKLRGLQVKTQVPIPIRYEGLALEGGLRLDLLVEGIAIVEHKAVEKVLPVHDAQILSYLKLTRNKLGFLLNFNVALMKNGISRFVL
jgi:GxxExxY protein